MMAILAVALMAGCGQGEQPSEGPEDAREEVSGPPPDMPEPDYLLFPVDTIGVELGDSNYVFGRIAAASFLPDGRIGILDMQKCRVSLFTPDGEFITSVGGKGSGPGEFLLPSSFSFSPEGGMIVADAMAGRISVFDSTLAYADEITGFFPSPPVGLMAVEGGAMIGMKPLFEQNEEGMFMGFEIARYDSATNEPSVVYFSRTEPFDPADLAGSFGESIALFTVSPDGRVYVSPMDSEEYSVTGYDPAGEVILEIERNVERVRKTDEEIQEEKELVESQMIAGGMPAEMANWNPPPYRIAIAGLGVGPDETLWVVRGSWGQPFCEVFDRMGEQLFTVAIDPSMDDTDRMQLLVTPQGFLAMDPNPEDYPRLYRLELQR